MTEQGVEVSSAPYGAAPTTAPDPAANPVTTISRVTTYGYNDDGTPKSVDITNGPHSGFGYAPAGPKLGMVANNVTTSGAGDPVSIEYGFEGDNSAFLTQVKANGAPLSQSEPHRDHLDLHDVNSTTSDATYDNRGRAKTILSSGGNSGCSDCGASRTISYLPDAPATDKHKRGLPDHVSEGAGELVKTRFEYGSETESTVFDARGVETKTQYDSWRRPIDVRVTMPGDTLSMEEQFDYDASGHLHKHRRMQDGESI